MNHIPLKYVAHINAGQSPPSSEVSDLAEGLPFLQGNAEFQHLSPAPRFQCDSAPKIAHPGDILLSVRAPVGALNMADRTYGIGRGLCAITPKSCDGRFLWWWLHTQREHMNSVSTGATYRAITSDDVGSLMFPEMPISEQRRISDYLDAQTAHVDRLSSLQQEMSLRLEERDGALLDLAIDDQITRSGTVPLRRFIWSVDQGVSPQCESVPAGDDEWGVLKVSCLRPGVFNPTENKRLPDQVEPDRRSEVREGDLLITRANTPQLVGSTAVVGKVRRRLLLPDKIFRVRLVQELDPEYVATLARGSRIRALCSAGSNGASSSMANIRFEEIKDWPIPAIPLTDQHRLVGRIAGSREQVSSLRSAIEHQIRLLAERRQALITAAVTGRMDVTTARGVDAA